MITGRTFNTLCRIGIALFTAASAVTGRLIIEPRFTPQLLLTAAGHLDQTDPDFSLSHDSSCYYWFTINFLVYFSRSCRISRI